MKPDDIHELRRAVQLALNEDGTDNDLTASLVPPEISALARLYGRENFMLCGTDWFEQSVLALDEYASFNWFFKEGENISKNQLICEVKANFRALLSAERTALNFLQLLSGVATKTREYVSKLYGHCQLLDTRKTLPGLRYAQKYAVRCGGGFNHRFGLFDAVLIKENHIKACGSIQAAVGFAKERYRDKKIEVEVESLDELALAIESRPDVIMLDNFSNALLEQAVALNRGNDIKLEASGNISLDNIADVSQTGVDYISVGDITKSVQAIDLSLLIGPCHES